VFFLVFSGSWEGALVENGGKDGIGAKGGTGGRIFHPASEWTYARGDVSVAPFWREVSMKRGEVAEYIGDSRLPIDSLSLYICICLFVYACIEVSMKRVEVAYIGDSRLLIVYVYIYIYIHVSVAQFWREVSMKRGEVAEYIGDSLAFIHIVLTNLVWCMAYQREVKGGHILPNSREIVLHQCGQCRRAGRMKGRLTRSQTTND